jgi:predicted Zn-dependent protease
MSARDRARSAQAARRVCIILALLAAGAWLLWWLGSALWVRREQAAAEADLAAFDFPAARRRLEKCLALQPRDPDLLLLAIQAARRDGLLDDASQLLDRYRELELSGREEQLQARLIDAARGQVQPHVKFLGAFIDRGDAAAEEILEALAHGCIQVYQFDRAAFWLLELHQRFPKNAVARLLRAQSTETYGNTDDALKLYAEVVADFPRFDRARQHYADALYIAQRYDEAIEQFTELRRRDPGRAATTIGLARSLQRLARHDEASPLLQELLAHHGERVDVLVEGGKEALRQGRLEDAETLLEKAVALAPLDREARLNLGICLGRQDKHAEAKVHLERAKIIEADAARMEKLFEAVVKAPHDPEPRLEAAQICLRNGSSAEGLRWLHGILEMAPEHAGAHRVLADFYAARGDHDRARQHRQRGQ